MANTKIRAAIVGATGYTGAEVLRLLLGHARVEVVLCTSREPGKSVADTYRHFAGRTSLALEPFDADDVRARADVAFVGLPHHAAMEAVVPLVERGVRVIDLSADFRLRNVDTYRAHYGEHIAPHLCAEAAYGLPELFRDEIRGARLVATPGCYPTSVILPLAPLLRVRLVSPRGIVADSKSGVSGAGRGATQDTHYTEVEGGLRAYKAWSHRHQPEMEEVLARTTGASPQILFAPHLVPMNRGIATSVYADLEDGAREADVRACLEAAYAREPFVCVLAKGQHPDTKHVAGTNYVHVNAVVDETRRKVLLLSALDNLVKGAAGAAVQSMNLMMGIDEREGLGAVALFP
jgi:N-acetyl-gamma-glutamyl-phosphate reductase